MLLPNTVASAPGGFSPRGAMRYSCESSSRSTASRSSVHLCSSTLPPVPDGVRHEDSWRGGRDARTGTGAGVSGLLAVIVCPVPTRRRAVVRAPPAPRGMLGMVTTHGSTVGQLLIAEPMLGDPNFDRAVVLMIQHDDDGALGVVLNRPTKIEVGDVLDEWAGLVSDPGVIHVGGPVEPNGVLALARCAPGAEVPGWRPVLGSVGTVDLRRGPAVLADGLEGIRFFAGHAGWEGGQLEAALADGARTAGP